jgi:hypothetical protein
MPVGQGDRASEDARVCVVEQMTDLPQIGPAHTSLARTSLARTSLARTSLGRIGPARRTSGREQQVRPPGVVLTEEGHHSGSTVRIRPSRHRDGGRVDQSQPGRTVADRRPIAVQDQDGRPGVREQVADQARLRPAMGGPVERGAGQGQPRQGRHKVTLGAGPAAQEAVPGRAERPPGRVARPHDREPSTVDACPAARRSPWPPSPAGRCEVWNR